MSANTNYKNHSRMKESRGNKHIRLKGQSNTVILEWHTSKSNLPKWTTIELRRSWAYISFATWATASGFGSVSPSPERRVLTIDSWREISSLTCVGNIVSGYSRVGHSLILWKRIAIRPPRKPQKYPNATC